MSECKYRASNGECLYQKQFPYIEYCVNGPCPNYTAMTNADRIRAMTDEELAEIISSDWCAIVCEDTPICGGQCESRVLDWLKAEAEGEDE